MPALTDEFDKELEAIYERFDLIKNKDFTLPENQKDIQTFLTLASDYLGKNLEEKTKLSIGYLLILISVGLNSPWLATIIGIKAGRSKGKFAVNTPQACLGDRQI